MLKAVLRGLLASNERHRTPAPSLDDAVRFLQQGRLDEAEAVARAVCLAQPSESEPRHVLGHILIGRGDTAEAIGVLEEATRAGDASAELHHTLGRALSKAGAFERAADSFRRAVDLAPAFPAGWISYADVSVVLGNVDAAEDSYLRALDIAPELAEAHYNFGNLLLRLGRIDEAVKSYARALELNADFRQAHTNLVYALNFLDGYPAEQVFRAHLTWAQRYAEPLTARAPPHLPRTSRGRRIRVGYVSPNFRRHAATYFFEPVLRHHDRGDFEIYCYSDAANPDLRTERLRRHECIWRDIAGQCDDAVAALVRDDEIDILVDLTGLTEKDRLLLFARKPAPIQVTWNGYANTTGMTAMDYRITDGYCDPPGVTEHLHAERLLRMPRIYMPFETPEDDVAPGEPPCLTRGHVTFGSFNALSKLNARMIRVWSQILNGVSSARLLLMTVPEGRTRVRVLEAFSAHGIDAGRIEFRARLSERAFLEAHRGADIALDTFPFHGTTTTAHSLWMGLPVVTLGGSVHASRVGVSMLSNIGLRECIASTEDEYIARAVELARDPIELQSMRSALRRRMLRAPNMDGACFTRDLESAYAHIWEAYCSTPV